MSHAAFCRAASKGFMISPRSGISSISSRIRLSNPTVPTMPTLSPKLRKQATNIVLNGDRLFLQAACGRSAGRGDAGSSASLTCTGPETD